MEVAKTYKETIVGICEEGEDGDFSKWATGDSVLYLLVEKWLREVRKREGEREREKKREFSKKTKKKKPFFKTFPPLLSLSLSLSLQDAIKEKVAREKEMNEPADTRVEKMAEASDRYYNYWDRR